MSRYYGMFIEVHDVRDEDEFSVVDEVTGQEWDGCRGDDYVEAEKKFQVYHESNLASGETPEEFVTRLSHAIWTALSRYVEINVQVTYIEDAPTDNFTADEEDYEKWKKEAK